jgi:hypothetical protein
MQGVDTDRQSGAPIVDSNHYLVGLTYGRLNTVADAAAGNSCSMSSVHSIRI